MLYRAPTWFVVSFWFAAVSLFLAVCWSAYAQARDADWAERVLDQINSHEPHA